MGTTYSIIAIDKNKLLSSNKIQTNIDSLLIDFNNYFSTYIKDSEVSIINNSNSTNYISISSKFNNLLLESREISKITNGAFDVTVKPLVNLWNFGAIKEKIFFKPSQYDIDSALKLVGNDKYIVDFRFLKKYNSNVQFDFNAIAKGTGIDIIASYLENIGIERYMIEIGGDIAVSGLNKNNTNWKIGITNPESLDTKLIETISVSDVAIATSGTYENYFYLDSLKYSHIIDPKSGFPVEHDLVSVTVLAQKASLADAIATALMVMGFDRSLEWVNSQNHIECYLVSKDKNGKYLIGYSEDFPIF